MMKGAVVIGVSPDSVASHAKFKAKLGLPFFLLSDPEKKVMGVIRSTFVIDEQGVIIKVFPQVKVQDHAQEVLQFL